MTRRRDHGQATVELALCLPLVTMVVLAVAQLVVVGLHAARLTSAARDAARAAAVSATPSISARRVVDSLRFDTVDVSTIVDDQWVTVLIHEKVPTDLPLVGLLVPDIDLQEKVTMLREPPLG